MPTETVPAAQDAGRCRRISALIRRWLRVRDQRATNPRDARNAVARIGRRVAVAVTVALGLDVGAVIARTFHAGTLSRGAWPTWALIALWCPLAFLAAVLAVTGVSRVLGTARRALRRGTRDGG